MKNKLKAVAYVSTITFGTVLHFTVQSTADAIAKAEGVILSKLDPKHSAKFYQGVAKDRTVEMQQKITTKISDFKMERLQRKVKLNTI